MGDWYRVFGRSEVEPAPAALVQHLHGQGLAVRPTFRGDDLGWFAADLALDDEAPLRLERFLTREEGIRGELNAWAAWLETVEHSPNHAALMERVIQTAQLFTLRPPDGSRMEPLCVALSRYLAEVTDGVYQADRRGFFAADGTLLLRE